MSLRNILRNDDFAAILRDQPYNLPSCIGIAAECCRTIYQTTLQSVQFYNIFKCIV